MQRIVEAPDEQLLAVLKTVTERPKTKVRLKKMMMMMMMMRMMRMMRMMK